MTSRPRALVHGARDMAEVLKAWRARLGWSEAQAAAFLEISEDLLKAWERGQPVPYPALVETAMQLPVAKKVLQ